MIQLLMTGSQQVAHREAFSLQCYRDLFALAACQDEKGASSPFKPRAKRPNSCWAVDSWRMRLAQQAAPMVMKRTSAVFQGFIDSEKVSGKTPLPRNMLREIIFVMTQLLEIQVHPSLALASSRDALPPTYTKSRRKHLLLLFPLLCECVTTQENSLRPLLKQLFKAAATEVGLK